MYRLEEGAKDFFFFSLNGFFFSPFETTLYCEIYRRNCEKLKQKLLNDSQFVLLRVALVSFLLDDLFKKNYIKHDANWLS